MMHRTQDYDPLLRAGEITVVEQIWIDNSASNIAALPKKLWKPAQAKRTAPLAASVARMAMKTVLVAPHPLKMEKTIPWLAAQRTAKDLKGKSD